MSQLSITLPPEYLGLPPDQMQRRVRQHKQRFGGELMILAHHYQRDEVVELADFVGDSLKLSRQAAATQARYIVFCGVHFMAESANILSHPPQVTMLPNPAAGCTMADMADDSAAAAALDELRAMMDEPVVPVTYVNSTAGTKAVTGRWGGACCTSGNARAVLQWAMRPREQDGAGGAKVLALPDQHLARNTAVAMGFSADDCVLYDPRKPAGGLSRQQVARARFILWNGFCYVHARFTPADVLRVRQQHAGIKVIVHPECSREVVELADAAGSTEQIIEAVDSSPAGTSWAIGTESNLVRRLAARHRSRKFIRELSDAPSFCRQMSLVDLPHLLYVLDCLADGRPVNTIQVPPAVAADARVALERMVAIG
jgi:quinolinate synthase